MIKFVGPLSFLPFADCGNRMSTIMTRSVMTASTNSGAIRPQSAAVTEYVNVMEIPRNLAPTRDATLDLASTRDATTFLFTVARFYLINALPRFCKVLTTDGS